MARLTDISPKILMLSAVVVALGLSAAAYFFIYQDVQTANVASAATLKTKQAENDQLRPYQSKLDEMNRQIASLKDQLEQMKKIVPDEKLADQFIHLMQDTATSAGVYIRRYSAKPLNTKEFYSEAPYEMEIDGPYYSMLNYFDKVRQLERIINVAGLKVANTGRGGDVGARHKYNYAPNESVVATCTTTTFFSRDNFTQPGAPSAAPVKK